LIVADRDGPLHFVNLLGFFPEAQYPRRSRTEPAQYERCRCLRALR
jgi:hypothetical protein